MFGQITDNNIPKELPQELIKMGFKTWDEILRIVPGKMEWNSVEDIAKRGQKPPAGVYDVPIQNGIPKTGE